MAKAKDSYVQKLGEIVWELEQLYGLAETNDLGVQYVELEIGDVINYENSLIMSSSADAKKGRNFDAGKYTVLVAYINDRLNFYGKKKLNYSDYPRMDVVAQCLWRFLQKNTIDAQALNSLNKVIYVLQEVDSRFVQHKFGLGYRFLRMFIVFAMWGNYCNAGVLARFIIDQLIPGEV